MTVGPAPEKILIIRLSSIGDIVQCSAVARHLRRHFLKSQIHWVVRSDNEDLLKLNPHIDKLIVFDRQLGFAGWLKLSRQLATANYAHVYDAHNNLRSFFLTLYLRFAPRPQKRPFQFIRRSKNRLKRFLLFWLKINLFSPSYTAVESYIAPLKRWQITYDGGGGELHVAPESIKKAARFLHDFENAAEPPSRQGPEVETVAEPRGGPSPEVPAAPLGTWIAIGPATAWPKKTWPLAYWKTLVAELLKSSDSFVVVLGGPTDLFCKELVLDPTRVLNLQGKLKLLESAAVAHLCTTLVAADTGLLHMGEAMNRDVVGILGPTPFGHPARSTSMRLQTKLWCQPCSKDGSGPCINREYQKCMKLVTPTVVLDAVSKVTLHQAASMLTPGNAFTSDATGSVHD